MLIIPLVSRITASSASDTNVRLDAIRAMPFTPLKASPKALGADNSGIAISSNFGSW